MGKLSDKKNKKQEGDKSGSSKKKQVQTEKKDINRFRSGKKEEIKQDLDETVNTELINNLNIETEKEKVMKTVNKLDDNLLNIDVSLLNIGNKTKESQLSMNDNILDLLNNKRELNNMNKKGKEEVYNYEYYVKKEDEVTKRKQVTEKYYNDHAEELDSGQTLQTEVAYQSDMIQRMLKTRKATTCSYCKEKCHSYNECPVKKDVESFFYKIYSTNDVMRQYLIDVKHLEHIKEKKQQKQQSELKKQKLYLK